MLAIHDAQAARQTWPAGEGPQWQWRMPESALLQNGSFSSMDRFVIINVQTGIAVEGAYNRNRALASTKTLNEHETVNGREILYDIRPIPLKIQDTHPLTWQAALDEGIECQVERFQAMAAKLKTCHYPPLFALVAFTQSNGLKSDIDWDSVHRQTLEEAIHIGKDRGLTALRDIIRQSPGAISHADQDALCELFESMCDQRENHSCLEKMT